MIVKPNRTRADLAILCTMVLIGGCVAAPSESNSTAQPVSPIQVNDNLVSASGEVVAGKWATLSFMMGSEQVEISVQTGDEVKDGDTLAFFPDESLPQAILNAQADLILARKSLEELLDSGTALAQASIAVRDAQKAYDRAFDHRESLNGLLDFTETEIKEERTPFGVIEVPKVIKYQAYATPSMIAKADEDLALQTALLADAQAELDRLINLENSAEVTAAQTRIKALEGFIRQSKLIAPFDGTVVEMYINSGEMVSPGAPVLLLADLSTLQVKTTDLNEVDVARLQIGDTVEISFDALPDTTITGKVSQISLKNTSGSGVYYDVIITLDDIPEGLRWGMSAFVGIQVSK